MRLSKILEAVICLFFAGYFGMIAVRAMYDKPPMWGIPTVIGIAGIWAVAIWWRESNKKGGNDDEEILDN